MEIEFDAAKDMANIAKHGMSLADATEIDFNMAAIVIDDRYDYGETRYLAFANVNGKGRCLVFAIVNGNVRAISYRRSRRKEMKRYGL